jgi:hypothetical protein
MDRVGRTAAARGEIVERPVRKRQPETRLHLHLAIEHGHRDAVVVDAIDAKFGAAIDDPQVRRLD